MILSDWEVQVLLEDRHIFIEPQPRSDLWSSTSLDLTLDPVVLKWTPQEFAVSGKGLSLYPGKPDFKVHTLMEDATFASRILIQEQDGYPLAPGNFVLGFTRQKVRFPVRTRIAARVEGKSSLARIGLGIHVTAPTIHAGFGSDNQEGIPIQLEIFNLGPRTIHLTPDVRICQLIFEEVRELPSAGYRGQFSQQQAFSVPDEPPSSPPTSAPVGPTARRRRKGPIN